MSPVLRLFASSVVVFPLFAAAVELTVQPGESLDAALVRGAEARRRNPREALVFTLGEGTHYLRGKPLEIGPALAGTEGAPTVVRGTPGRTVIHAGYPLGPLDWTPVAGMAGVWAAKLPAGIPPDFGQLYLAGARQTLARFPNATDPESRFQGSASGLPGARAGLWKSPSAVYFHAITANGWGSVHYRVAPNGSAAPKLEGGWQLNREARPGSGMVEGPVEEIDVGGEWAVRDGYLHFKAAG